MGDVTRMEQSHVSVVSYILPAQEAGLSYTLV